MDDREDTDDELWESVVFLFLLYVHMYSHGWAWKSHLCIGITNKKKKNFVACPTTIFTFMNCLDDSQIQTIHGLPRRFTNLDHSWIYWAVDELTRRFANGRDSWIRQNMHNQLCMINDYCYCMFRCILLIWRPIRKIYCKYIMYGIQSLVLHSLYFIACTSATGKSTMFP